MIRPEFKVHTLNDNGQAKTRIIAEAFTDLLTTLETLGVAGRALSLVKTNLETACFNAKRGIAELAGNQQASYVVEE